MTQRGLVRAQIPRSGTPRAYAARVPRPRIHDDRITTAVRLPPDLHERLRRAADERQVSVNYLIQKSLEDYLHRLIPISEIELTR